LAFSRPPVYCKAVAVVVETEAVLEEEEAAAASATVGAVCNHASEILGCVLIFLITYFWLV
jgi:hypothetical protein